MHRRSRMMQRKQRLDSYYFETLHQLNSFVPCLCYDFIVWGREAAVFTGICIEVP